MCNEKGERVEWKVIVAKREEEHCEREKGYSINRRVLRRREALGRKNSTACERDKGVERQDVGERAL